MWLGVHAPGTYITYLFCTSNALNGYAMPVINNNLITYDKSSAYF